MRLASTLTSCLAEATVPALIVLKTTRLKSMAEQRARVVAEKRGSDTKLMGFKNLEKPD
jgi:hypothetical protein